jgi:hypothetical protein
MRILFILLLQIFSVTSLFSQLCATDKINSINSTPQTKRLEQKMNKILYDFTVAHQQRNSNSVQVIPIVFHVIHNNGPENIPDSLIIAAVAETNLRLQNSAPYYDSSGHDIQIQLCLASIDERGNASTGIDRYVSAYTNLFSTNSLSDIGMKNLSRWSPHLYLNVWVVNSLAGPFSGAGGFSNYPSNAGQGTDGIVLQYLSVNGTVLSHEIGHYLGLYHTFNGGCTNYNCLLNGDFICDTPPDATNSNNICPFNSCSTEMDDTSGSNPFTNDMDDLPNYMDYTSCPRSFSAGQSFRMNASLTQFRSSLLHSNGCGQNPGGTIPTASFQFVDTCPFPYFVATDTNALGGYWDFDSDGIIDDYGKYVSSPFTSVGTHNIRMIAVGYGGVDSMSQVMTIFGKPEQHYPMTNAINGVGGSVYDPEQQVFCQGNTVTFSGVPGFVSYQWSNGDTSRVVSFIPDSAFYLSLTAIDSNGHVWTSCFPINAIPAPPAIPPVLSFIPYDSAYCYDDYGSTITIHADLSPIRYNVTWYQMGGQQINVPDSANYAYVIQSFSNYFVVDQVDSNMCFSSDQIFLNLDYNTPAFNITQNGDSLFAQTGGAHYKWYLDGVQLSNHDSNYFVMNQPGCYTVFAWYGAQEGCGRFASDTICKIISSVNDVHDEILVYPNPVNNYITVKLFNNYEKRYTLCGSTGVILKRGKLQGNVSHIDFSDFPKGVYFLKIDEHVIKVLK